MMEKNQKEAEKSNLTQQQQQQQQSNKDDNPEEEDFYNSLMLKCSSSSTRNPKLRLAGVEDAITIRRYEPSRCAKFWEVLSQISDYRNRLAICIGVTLILAGFTTALIIRTLMAPPSKSGHNLTLPDTGTGIANVLVVGNIGETFATSNPLPAFPSDEHEEEKEDGDYLLKQGRPPPIIPQPKPTQGFCGSISMVLIWSCDQLNSLNSSVKTIRIKSLDDCEYDVAQGKLDAISTNTGVTTLLIDSAISEDLLIQILKNFVNVKSLTLNVGRLCTGATHEEIEELPTLDLSRITYFRLANCYDCPIIDWLLSSKIRKLNHLALCNSSINRRTYVLIKSFVQRAAKDVEIDTEGNKNKFCPDCSFKELESSHEVEESEEEVHLIAKREVSGSTTINSYRSKSDEEVCCL